MLLQPSAQVEESWQQQVDGRHQRRQEQEICVFENALLNFCLRTNGTIMLINITSCNGFESEEESVVVMLIMVL